MARNRTERRPDNRVLPLRIGQPFNPFKLFTGIFIPEGLVRYRGLSPGAKLVYGRFARYAGEKGDCYPSIQTLANEVGIGKTQTRTYVHELVEKRFIAIEERPGSSGFVKFLWHEAFAGDVGEKRKAPPLRLSGGVSPRKTANPPLRKTGDPPLRKTGAKESQSEENQVKESQQQAAAETELQTAPLRPNQPVNGTPGERGAAGDVASSKLPSTSAVDGDDPAVDGYPELKQLLDDYGVTARKDQVQAVIAAGRQQGLTLTGIFAFVRDKLNVKIARNDAVFSGALILRAITDRADLQRWCKMRPLNSFFERTSDGGGGAGSSARGSNQPLAAAFNVDNLRNHFSSAAVQLRAIAGFEPIARSLDLLNENCAGQIRDLESLEQRLIMLEDEMRVIAGSRLREDDVEEIRAHVKFDVGRYQGRMFGEQFSTLERAAFDRRVFERLGLPRLSLFYLNPVSKQAA